MGEREGSGDVARCVYRQRRGLGSGIGITDRSSDISKGEREGGIGDIGISDRFVGER